jgi:cullin 1
MATAPAVPSIFATDIPPRTADLEEIWVYLHRGVDHIMTKPNEGLSFLDYTRLYSTVYNYSTTMRMTRSTSGNRSIPLSILFTST